MFLAVTFFFFNDTATTEIYTLSLHDALPISLSAVKYRWRLKRPMANTSCSARSTRVEQEVFAIRSEEHTSELQSRLHLVCRLLLEKKKTVARAQGGVWLAILLAIDRHPHTVN